MNRKDGCETCQRLDAGQGVTPKRNIFDDEVGRDAVNRQSRKLLHPLKQQKTNIPRGYSSGGSSTSSPSASAVGRRGGFPRRTAASCINWSSIIR